MSVEYAELTIDEWHDLNHRLPMDQQISLTEYILCCIASEIQFFNRQTRAAIRGEDDA